MADVLRGRLELQGVIVEVLADEHNRSIPTHLRVEHHIID
jgi:hypothetical protein